MKNKKIIIIVSALVVCLVLVGGIFVFSKPKKPTSSPKLEKTTKKVEQDYENETVTTTTTTTTTSTTTTTKTTIVTTTTTRKTTTTMNSTTVITSKPTTTTVKANTTTTTTTVVATSAKQKQVVSNETIKEEEILDTRYGTRKIKEVTYNVVKYDDNTSEKNYISEKTYYDKSGYNASTSDVIGEARTVSSQNSGIYNEILSYVNKNRADANVSPLTLDSNLSVAATIRALEMAYSSGIYDISHTRPNGSSCFSVIDELNISNFTSMGENVAAGQRSAYEVSNGWYNSPGHRANIEKESFTKIGIGMYELNGIKYWVQLFIG